MYATECPAFLRIRDAGVQGSYWGPPYTFDMSASMGSSRRVSGDVDTLDDVSLLARRICLDPRPVIRLKSGRALMRSPNPSVAMKTGNRRYFLKEDDAGSLSLEEASR